MAHSRSYSVQSRPQSRMSSAVQSTAETDDVGHHSVALIESRSLSKEIGLVAFNHETTSVTVSQYSDTSTFVRTLSLISSRPPCAIIVPVTSDGTGKGIAGSKLKQGKEESMLVRSLKSTWEHVPVIQVARKHWNEQQGFEFLQKLIVEDDEKQKTLTACEPKYYALSAASALFLYLKVNQNIAFPSKTLRIQYAPLEGTMVVDQDTITHLELVSNNFSRRSKECLLGLLNRTHTPMAERLLRTNIISPLTSVETIDSRLDAVAELVSSEEKFSTVKKSLEPLRKLDLDKLIAYFLSPRTTNPSTTLSIKSAGDPTREIETKVTRILQLRTVLQALPAIRGAIVRSSSGLLKTIETLLLDERNDDMLASIEATIDVAVSLDIAGYQTTDHAAGETARRGGGRKRATAPPGSVGNLASRNLRIYAVRSERKMFLAVARETYRENVEDCIKLEARLQEEYGLPVELASVGGKGGEFVFCLKSDSIDGDKKLPSEFINVSTKAKKIEFTTLELKKTNARISNSLQEIFLHSQECVTSGLTKVLKLLSLDEVIEEVRRDVAALYRCSEAIAMLDMITAFASISSAMNYVRPEWVPGTLAVKGGRHPLFEAFRLSDGSFVPNDTFASGTSTFQLIFGPNMAGKSTFLKQIGLLQIMGQIGCFVPATYASFTVVDALLSRFSNDDSIEAGLSTFALEMKTMGVILSNMTSFSHPLLLIDELGRGTSPQDGLAIAHAISEEIVRSKVFCFFATHFKELSQTLGAFPNVHSLHLETEIDPDQEFSMTFHHHVRDGPTEHKHYGLELAKTAGLPADVIEGASKISHQLESLATKKVEPRNSGFISRRKVLMELATNLRHLQTSRAPNSAIVNMLVQLQADVVDSLDPDDFSTATGGTAAPTGTATASRSAQLSTIRGSEVESEAETKPIELELSQAGSFD